MKKKEKKRIKKALLAIVENGLAESHDRFAATSLLFTYFGEDEDAVPIKITTPDSGDYMKKKLTEEELKRKQQTREMMKESFFHLFIPCFVMGFLASFVPLMLLRLIG